MKLLAFLLLQVFLSVNSNTINFPIDYDYDADEFKWLETTTEIPTTVYTTPNITTTKATTRTIPTITPNTPTSTIDTKPTTTPTTPTTPTTTPTTPTTPTTTPTTPTTPTTTPTTPTTPTTTPTTSTTPTTTTTTKPTTPTTTPNTPTTITTTPTTKPTTPTTPITTPTTTPTTPTTTPTTKPTTPTTTPTTPTTPTTTLTTKPTTPTTTPTTKATTPTTPVTVTTTASPQTKVEETETKIDTIEIEYANKNSLDLEYIRKFSQRLNEYKTEFNQALQEQVYKAEDTKRIELRSALRNNRDIECVNGYAARVNIAKKLGQDEFEFCEKIIKSQVQLQIDQVTIAKERIKNEITKARLQTANCKQVFTARYDLDLYGSCTQSAKNILINAIQSYNISIRGQETKNRIIELAECADTSLQKIETSLNENYKIIKSCLQSSGSSSSANIINNFVDKYAVDLKSINLTDQVKTAIRDLTADIEQTTQAAAVLKARYEDTIKIRNRNLEAVKDSLELLPDVNKYRLAFLKATTDLERFNNAKPCLNQFSNKIRDNLNERGKDMMACYKSRTLIPNTINQLLNNLKTQDLKEGLIAVVNCFASRRTTLFGDITASCSKTADRAFNLYLVDVDKEVATFNDYLKDVKDVFDYCQENVLPNLHSQFDRDESFFETCVQGRIYENYQLDLK